MKRKLVLLGFMILAMGFVNANYVLGYSPHYLPGGKNYLSEENFTRSGSNYESDAPFLVMPYTDYTLTVARDYADELTFEIEIVSYENSIYLESIYFEIKNMTFYNDGQDEWYYCTFTTSSDTNYLSIIFNDESGYFLENGLSFTQLEEGNSSTEHEPYIDGVLIDTQAPYFQNAGTVLSYYDSPITISEIQSALTAYDAIDGNVSSNISLIQDNYTASIDTLGTYTVIFEVTDSSSNNTQVTIEVELVDVLNPVFSELSTIQAVFPNIYTSNDILAMLSASDNYDGDISGQIVLVTDNYTNEADRVGNYDMSFSVTDSSGNIEIYTQSIEVVDNQSPIISGVTSITVGYDGIVTQAQVEANLNYTDNYDESSSLSLTLESDSYSENTTSLGTYSMIFSVTDSSGNISNQEVSITVVDEIGPLLYFDSSIIQTYTDTVMDLPDFTQLLINSNEIDNQDYFVTVTYDSYTRNANQPGTYHLSLNLENETGDEISKDLEIRVIERPIDFVYEIPAEINEKLSFFEEYKSYITGGIASILLVFSNIVWIAIFKKKS